MTLKQIKNLSASVRQKLFNHAKQTNRSFNEVLKYYSLERYLYRLAQSPYANKFILKGALMLAAWKSPITRPTKDIDLLGQLENDVANLIQVARKICRQSVEPDGVLFDEDSVEGHRIAEEAEYAGVRIRLAGTLGTAKLTLQLDVGFGDVVHPGPGMITFPTLIDLPAPRLKGYSRESVIAEKYHTMIHRHMLNSRLKDYYDVWMLARQFDYQGSLLAEAIYKTFAHRDTPLGRGFSQGFSDAFNKGPIKLLEGFGKAKDKAAQWRIFLRNNRLEHAPKELKEAVKTIINFLEPVTLALVSNQPFKKAWKAPGPWR